MQFNFGSTHINLIIPANGSTSQLVTVDGAEKGACIPSFDPPFESLDVLMSAHVDSSGVARVIIENKMGQAVHLDCALTVTNIEQ